MMQTIRQLFWVTLSLGVLATPAMAQSTACRAAFKAITTLRPPHLGVPPVWDAMYGPPGFVVRLGTGLQLPDGAILTAGQITAQAGNAAPQLVFATINGRGRVDHEKRLAAPDGEWPVKLLALKNSYALLSNITVNGQQEARLSWYDKNLNLEQSATIQDSAFNIQGVSLILSADGKSILAALHATHRTPTGEEQAILARFDIQGKKLWQRNFSFGVSNAINGIAPVGNDGFLAAGHIRLDDGRLAGWLLRVDAQGAMSWQKTYPAGAYADFTNITPAGPFFIAGGVVASTAGGANGVWLAEFDLSGALVWQHYLRTPKFSLSPVALQTLPNGLLLATVNATGQVIPPTSSSELNHIRLITFSPRGELASDDSYVEGGGAQAADAAPGSDDTRAIIANLLPDEKSATPQGWVFVGPAPAPYKDPCGMP